MEWTIQPGKTYAIIGARGGSKNVPQKNIRLIEGFPLIAYSIVAAKLTKGVERVIVSTDSEQIAEIAKKFGAEVPFLRPAELATDHSIDREFIVHALEWLQENERGIPEYLLFLRPTSPLRDPQKITEALELIKNTPDATGLRSAHISDAVPQKMFALNGKYFTGLFPDDTRPEYHGFPRQAFPPSYKADGYTDVLKSATVLSNPDTTYGENILAFVTPDTGDIDVISDLHFVHAMLASKEWEVYEYLKKHYKALQEL